MSDERHGVQAAAAVDLAQLPECLSAMVARTRTLTPMAERFETVPSLKQFQMFDLHVVKDVPAREVARRLGAKLMEVYFAKYQISKRLKKEIRRLERD